MATGYHDFTAGETLTAANLEDYCEKQSVMVFASAAARNAALAAVLQEGMYAFLQDVNTLTVYSGAAWSTVGPQHGALTSWTPTVTQSGSVTVTNTSSTYQRHGRLVTCRFLLAVTGSGSANNAVVIGGLPFTGANSQGVVGSGMITDSGTAFYAGFIAMASTTTLNILSPLGASTNIMGFTLAGSFGAALASSDVLSGTFAYEAAADA